MGNNRNVGRLIRRVTTSSTTRPSKKYPATKDRPSQPLPTPTIKLILFIFYLCVCMCVSFSPSVFACPSPHIFQEPSSPPFFFFKSTCFNQETLTTQKKENGKTTVSFEHFAFWSGTNWLPIIIINTPLWNSIVLLYGTLFTVHYNPQYLCTIASFLVFFSFLNFWVFFKERKRLEKGAYLFDVIRRGNQRFEGRRGGKGGRHINRHHGHVGLFQSSPEGLRR